ncbi:hypothetical protein V5F77_13795 [Xanthobacter sp. DSM 24535]|uniref:hypothetical protein n=1 Tax=Roseixanthobacter psychrophilus TaxID=3119917 RepID=UPI0037261F07
MRTKWMVTLAGVALSGLLLFPMAGVTQVNTPSPTRDHYIPRLGDIMETMQLRHFKLWFAGRLGNWDLAEYELGQIRASFEDALMLYPGIPVADMSSMTEPAHLIGEAIRQKDGAKFAAAFHDMTGACNACHQSIGRGFIIVQVPTSSPFSNQSFAPPVR